MSLQDQCNYIYDYYNRYSEDIVDVITAHTCFDILNWMSQKDEFNNVIYAAGIKQDGKNYGELIGEKGKKELVERLFKDRRIKHRRKTLERCVGNLMKDMYVKEEELESFQE